jgi:hypothetical protein
MCSRAFLLFCIQEPHNFYLEISDFEESSHSPSVSFCMNLFQLHGHISVHCSFVSTSYNVCCYSDIVNIILDKMPPLPSDIRLQHVRRLVEPCHIVPLSQVAFSKHVSCTSKEIPTHKMQEIGVAAQLSPFTRRPSIQTLPRKCSPPFAAQQHTASTSR